MRLRWILGGVLGWTILAIVFALPGLTNENPRQALLGSLAYWWAWGLVSLLLAALDARLPWSEKQLAPRLLAHLPLSILLTCLYTYVAAALRAAFGLSPWSAVTSLTLLTQALRGMILWSWLNYWLILGALIARRYYVSYLNAELRTERLERLSSEARLHTLRLQLDPHFLFNALNTISAQVESDPRLARGMIEHLGDLLRLSLETKDQSAVTLAREMDLLEHYLAIQRIRFAERLRVHTSIPEDLQRALVPAMLVQPLVENAVRHGLAHRAAGGQIWVDAHRQGDLLRLAVSDDGAGLPPGWNLDGHCGIGLSVTRQRLQSLGGSSFHVGPRPGGGTSVEILLPLTYAS